MQHHGAASTSLMRLTADLKMLCMLSVLITADGGQGFVRGGPTPRQGRAKSQLLWSV